jgi:hypothetical protein
MPPIRCNSCTYVVAAKAGAALEADKPGATKALVSITEFNWLVMRLY